MKKGETVSVLKDGDSLKITLDSLVYIREHSLFSPHLIQFDIQCFQQPIQKAMVVVMVSFEVSFVNKIHLLLQILRQNTALVYLKNNHWKIKLSFTDLKVYFNWEHIS